MPEVKHVRDYGSVGHVRADPTAIYVGRPTKWGNPFIIGTDGTRDEVIQMYRDRLMVCPPLLELLPLLRGSDLVCWCAPQPCHADVLLELANKE